MFLFILGARRFGSKYGLSEYILLKDKLLAGDQRIGCGFMFGMFVDVLSLEME